MSPDEVLALWDQCRPVTRDNEIAGWLTAARIDPERTEAFDLARALPHDILLPAWAQYKGQPWNVAGCRLILKLYSPEGALMSLFARALKRVDGRVTKKSFPPVDGATGFVMANDVGLDLLRTGDWPPNHDWPTVIIAGGAIDFLDWATSVPSQSPAVLGIVTGSWTRRIAERIPAGARVIVRAHRNPITGRYAHKVSDHLADRCEVIVRTEV